MKALMILPLLGCAWLAGCGDSGSSSSQSSRNPAAAPAEYLGALAKAEQKAVKTVDLTALTKAIEMFQVDQGRWPKDLNELVSQKYIPRIPDAPVGQKIAYDAATGTVKLEAQ